MVLPDLKANVTITQQVTVSNPGIMISILVVFCGVVCVVTCPFDISVGVGAFVIGLGQISSFLSCYWLHQHTKY